MLLFVCSFAIAQGKEQERYTIEKLGNADGFDFTVLLDSQTGKCWQLVADTAVVAEQGTGKLVQQTFYVWKPMLYIHNLKPIAPNYPTTPEPIEPSTAKK